MVTTGIIGLGKVGRTLAKALAIKNSLIWTCSTSLNKSSFIEGIPNFSSIEQIPELPDITFICKNDLFIADTAKELCEKLKFPIEGKIIIHTSGSFPVTALNCFEERGAIIGSAHPYQTFHSENPQILEGIAWTIDIGKGFDKVEKLIREMGGRAFDIRSKPNFNRALYHASAIIASNYMNTLIYYSSKAGDASGIDSNEYLPAILKTTLDNILASMKSGEAMTLTGPIARGEIETVQKHMIALSNEPELLSLYIFFGKLTTSAALAQNIISIEIAGKLTDIFNQSTFNLST